MKSINFLFCFLFICSFCFTQEHICPQIISSLKIENTNDIPTVIDNEDGTISLIHNEQYITDIFSNYVIYDFYQYSPSSNPDGELFKVYSIVYKSSELIKEMKEDIPPSIFNSYTDYDTQLFNSELISFLDNKEFYISQSWINWSDSGSLNEKENVPTNFDLKIKFNYNSNDDLLLMQSIGETPCNNSFSIAIKETTNGSFILWEIYNTNTSSNTAPNCEIEKALYAILKIACDYIEYGYENLNLREQFSIKKENSTLQLFANTITFGYLEITFEEEKLSTQSYNSIDNLSFYETKNSPYLQVKNLKNKELYIEITSLNGKTLFSKNQLKDNEININMLASGIYFIKILNPSSNQTKVFKFLKQ